MVAVLLPERDRLLRSARLLFDPAEREAIPLRHPLNGPIGHGRFEGEHFCRRDVAFFHFLGRLFDQPQRFFVFFQHGFNCMGITTGKLEFPQLPNPLFGPRKNLAKDGGEFRDFPRIVEPRFIQPIQFLISGSDIFVFIRCLTDFVGLRDPFGLTQRPIC